MLTASLLLGGALLQAKTLSLVPTDDAWVYPHGGDAMNDVYIRAWGADGNAVAQSPNDADAFSYTYMKFDVSGVPAGAKIKTGKLVLTHVPNAGYPKEAMTKTPLEVRAIGTDWSEKKWQFEISKKNAPKSGKEAIFGTSTAAGYQSDKEFKIEIDLSKSEGFAALLKASAGKELGLCLTSRMDPGENGRAYIYKMFSRNEEKASRRPVLELELD